MNIEQFIELYEYFEERHNEELMEEIQDLKSELEGLKRYMVNIVDEYELIIEQMK